MKRKLLAHLAALALVGWYLMAPPLVRIPTTTGPSSPTPASAAPLSRWKQIGQFDRAKDCEQALAKEQAIYQGEPGFMKDPDALASTYARCIASDDPRLKEKN